MKPVVAIVLSLLLVVVFCAQQDQEVAKPAVRAEDVALVILSFSVDPTPVIKDANFGKMDLTVLVSYQEYLKNSLKSPIPPATVAPMSDAAIDYAKIINLAKQAWAFIEKNKAVSNYESSFANALPQGVSSAFQLHSWSAPQARSYNIKYKNLLGITILDFTYTVTFIHGGKMNNKGSYLDHVTIIPTNIFVQWGWTFNAQVNIRSVTNAGSMENPVAAISVELGYKLSALNSQQTTESFYVRGDGAFQWVNRRGF